MTPLWFEDWASIGRIVLFGTLGYIALVAILRTSGKRTLSKMNAFDFIITIALGSTFATFLLSDQLTFVEGVVALGLLVGLQWVATALYVRSRRFEKLIKGAPRLLYWQGDYLDRALQEERVTRDEVRAAMREHGVSDHRRAAAVLETDGNLSVLTMAALDDHPVLDGVDHSVTIGRSAPGGPNVSTGAGGVGRSHGRRSGRNTMSDTDRSTRLQQEGTWDQFKGKAREQWGDLTDQELEQARGNWDQFIGTVKEKTGETAETIECKVDDWTS